MMHRRIITLATLGLALILPLAGCAVAAETPGPDSVQIAPALPEDSAPGPGGEVEAGSPDSGTAADLGGSGASGLGNAAGSAGAARAETGAGRVITRSGEIAITVADPDSASERVSEVARELDGYVESEYVAADSATLTVRVPAKQIDAAFTRLGEVGAVQSQSRSGADVTSEFVDLEARVAALKTSVARLTALLSEAATTSELLEAETALSARQQELDGLTAQLGWLEDQVDEATVWVTLSTEQVLPGGGPTTFWDGVLTGIGSLGAAAAGGLVLLGVALPWLVIAAAITGLVVWLVRRRRRRSSRRITPAATPPLQQGADH